VSRTTSEGQAVVSYEGTQGRAILYAASSAPEVTRHPTARKPYGFARAVAGANTMPSGLKVTSRSRVWKWQCSKTARARPNTKSTSPST
jgi:hypothetical protein